MVLMRVSAHGRTRPALSPVCAFLMLMTGLSKAQTRKSIQEILLILGRSISIMCVLCVHVYHDFSSSACWLAGFTVSLLTKHSQLISHLKLLIGILCGAQKQIAPFMSGSIFGCYL